MKDLFAKYQQPLLKIVNHSLGKKYLGFLPKEKIVGLTANVFAIEKGNEIEATLRCRPIFENRLKLALSGLRAYEDLLDGIKYYLEPRQIAYINFNTDIELPSNAGGDGYTHHGATSTWSTHRNAATGTYCSNSTSSSPPSADKDSGNYTIRRPMYPFLSTALDGITPKSAILKFYGTSGSVTSADSAYTCITGSTQADCTNLVLADYGRITLNSPTEYADRRLVTSWVNDYMDFTLNADGLAAIDDTGYTKFCTRSSRDVDNQAPSGINRPYCYDTDEAGTDKDPLLVVTYTPAGGGAFLMNFIS